MTFLHATPPRLRPRRAAAAGWTLIEAITVLVVMMILATVAVVAFNAVSNSWDNHSSTSALSRVAGAEGGFVANYGAYTPDPTDLTGTSPSSPQNGVGPDLSVVSATTASTGPGVVSIGVAAGLPGAVATHNGELGLAVLSGANPATCEVETIAPPSITGTTTVTTVPAGTVTSSTIPGGYTCDAANAIYLGGTYVESSSVSLRTS